mmetsp:Transcript_9333/g.25427  ORF Transcript_9333/g.25427 Transcript_9333/m.25427 type:complete len:296 (-) Transcript_9333:103-990(-)
MGSTDGHKRWRMTFITSAWLLAGSGDSEAAQIARKGIRIRAASFSRAKPGRLPFTNEDASFVNPTSFGVLDGVSSAKGSRAYSRGVAQRLRGRLSLRTVEACLPRDWARLAEESLEHARHTPTVGGACTATVAAVLPAAEASDAAIWCASSLGDSGAMLFLPMYAGSRSSYRLASRTSNGMHAPNCPYQMPADPARLASVRTQPIPRPTAPRQGPAGVLAANRSGKASPAIGLLYSDGLVDNVSEAEICDEVSRRAGNQHPIELARALVHRASRMRIKPDDITVVCVEIRATPSA